MCFLEGPFHLTGRDKELLLSVSPTTIDRLMKADRKKLALKGKSGTKPGKLLKKQIPVRTYYADADKKLGFFKIDTVHHCGTSDSGEFCLTLTAADVYSGWTELRPTLNKAHKWVFQALLDIKSSLPFPLTSIYSDNGSEFINSALLKLYDKKVVSPYQRLLASPDLCDEAKAELTGRFALYDPVKLQREARNAVDVLVSLNRAVNLEGESPRRSLPSCRLTTVRFLL